MAGWDRLDVYPMPSAVIERFGHRMKDWIVRTDVNVEALAQVFQRPMKHHVFKILGVTNERHGASSVVNRRGGRRTAREATLPQIKNRRRAPLTGVPRAS